MTNILPFFKKTWEYRAILLTIAFVVLAILFVKQCNGKKYIEEKAAQNEAFYKEEIKTHKIKDGRYQSERAVLMATMSELKKDTSFLAKEVIRLKKEGSKPKVVFVTQFVYVDSGSVENFITNHGEDKYSVDFNYQSDDSILSVKGRNFFQAKPYKISDTQLGLTLKPGKTHLDSIRVSMSLTLGVKEDKDGIDRVFATANSPKITFTKLDAVEVENYFKNKYSDKKKKRIGIGPYVGFGITVGPLGISYGPTLGIGVQYNFIRF